MVLYSLYNCIVYGDMGDYNARFIIYNIYFYPICNIYNEIKTKDIAYSIKKYINRYYLEKDLFFFLF